MIARVSRKDEVKLITRGCPEVSSMNTDSQSFLG